MAWKLEVMFVTEATVGIDIGVESGVAQIGK